MSLVSVGIVQVIKTVVIKIVKTVKTAGSWSCMHVEVHILLLLLSCCVAVTESDSVTATVQEWHYISRQ
jgi:hypothetical protein